MAVSGAEGPLWADAVCECAFPSIRLRPPPFPLLAGWREPRRPKVLGLPERVAGARGPRCSGRAPNRTRVGVACLQGRVTNCTRLRRGTSWLCHRNRWLSLWLLAHHGKMARERELCPGPGQMKKHIEEETRHRERGGGSVPTGVRVTRSDGGRSALVGSRSLARLLGPVHPVLFGRVSSMEERGKHEHVRSAPLVHVTLAAGRGDAAPAGDEVPEGPRADPWACVPSLRTVTL